MRRVIARHRPPSTPSSSASAPSTPRLGCHFRALACFSTGKKSRGRARPALARTPDAQSLTVHPLPLSLSISRLQLPLARMKLLKSQRVLAVPEGVEVSLKARKITVKGPRGTLTRDFTHIPHVDMVYDKENNQIVSPCSSPPGSASPPSAPCAPTCPTSPVSPRV